MSIDPVREFIIPKVVSNHLIYDEAYKYRSAFIHNYIGEFLPQPPCNILNFGCGLNL